MSWAIQDSSQCSTPDSGASDGERDGRSRNGCAVLQRQHDQRRQHADADEGDDAQHAQHEGRGELALPRQDHLHQRATTWYQVRPSALMMPSVTRLHRAARRVGRRSRRGAGAAISVGSAGAVLLARLFGHQAGIDAAPRHQRVVASLFGDLAAVEHQDAVAIDHARQAMGEDQRRAALHQPVERLLDHRLVLGIDGRQRLVEHQDRRVAQQRAGDGDALALAARELDALLADRRLIALRQGRG